MLRTPRARLKNIVTQGVVSGI
ncbi:hypothetical protein KVR801_220037 [Klebsiella variicola]|nr:hypothetical protein KVR801_220037 [Klebsiella variicola]CEP30778.1 hypothetical protein KV8917_420097 [Klebsiella variicola]